MTRQEKFENYDAFVEKFKPKKTTDDCMTPPEIYEAVRDYVCRRWGIDPARAVRPFWPGGDYESFPYEPDSVVIDNPPFSILSKIIRFYLAEEIPFFLFAPTLTLVATVKTDAHAIITDCKITYENGAKVKTSFVTSFGRDVVFEIEPELTRLVNEKMDEITRSRRASLPQYEYPPELITAALAQKYAAAGFHFEVKRDECVFIRQLDAQKQYGKAVFGAGLLLTEEKARQLNRVNALWEASKREASKREAKYTWELSERERGILKLLSRRGENQ